MDNKIEQYKVPLPKKDILLLRELNQNSRQSFSKIGKKIRLPKSVVAYRVKRLQESGVLNLFCTTINRPALGKMYCRLFLKFRMFSDPFEKELIDFIKKLLDIHWVARLDGPFDIGIIFLADSIPHANEIYDNILFEFDKLLLDKEFSIASETRFFPYNYLYESSVGSSHIVKEAAAIQIDALDKAIINSIKQDSRKSLLSIAEETNVSVQTVRTKIRSLQMKKMITGFNIRIDATKLNLIHFHTFLSLTNMNKIKMRELKEYLSGLKSTTQIIKGFGRFDLEFESFLPSHVALHELLNNLQMKFPLNIVKHETAHIYKIYPINTVRY